MRNLRLVGLLPTGFKRPAREAVASGDAGSAVVKGGMVGAHIDDSTNC